MIAGEWSLSEVRAGQNWISQMIPERSTAISRGEEALAPLWQTNKNSR